MLASSVVADDGIDAMAPQHDVHAAGAVSDEALDGAVDMVLMMRELHMMKNWGTLDTWLRASFRMLKPNGILGSRITARRRGRTRPCATTGHLPEAWVIEQVEAAGFKLVARPASSL